MDQHRASSNSKIDRRTSLLAAAGGREPAGTGSPCAECDVPRTAFNTAVIWSDKARTRLTFHYSVCDSCRSARACKRLRTDPLAKITQMGADASARTKRAKYDGEALPASKCAACVASLLDAQRGRCASCKHALVCTSGGGIFMATLDKVGSRYDDGSAQVLCMGCQRFFNDLDSAPLFRCVALRCCVFRFVYYWTTISLRRSKMLFISYISTWSHTGRLSQISAGCSE